MVEVPGATMNVEGLERALLTLSRVRNLGADPRPLLEIAGAVLRDSVIDRFNTETGPDGIPWPKSRRALGQAVGPRGPLPPGKTLQDTGDLRDSIRYEVRPGEVEVGADGLKNPVKAVANQFGSRRPTVVGFHVRTINSAFGIPLPEPRQQFVSSHTRQTNLPPRPFIGVNTADHDQLLEAWHDHLLGLFDG